MMFVCYVCLNCVVFVKLNDRSLYSGTQLTHLDPRRVLQLLVFLDTTSVPDNKTGFHNRTEATLDNLTYCKWR